MPGACATCRHPQVREINHRIREGRPYEDISRWLDEIKLPITRQALARHHKAHLGEVPERPQGRKPLSRNFLEAVVETAQDKLENGELAVTVRDGISAQAELNRQMDRSADRDLMAKIALALTGNVFLPEVRVLDPELAAIEAEFRPLLTAGAE
jgi:hypothetical protein